MLSIIRQERRGKNTKESRERLENEIQGNIVLKRQFQFWGTTTFNSVIPITYNGAHRKTNHLRL